MLTYKEIENTFINYFVEKNHTFVPECSLAPKNDKSILFTNSGMIQFKNIFLGLEQSDLVSACNSQKCIRAGGKHNDFDDVGRDNYHHTMFNMLGNWSFNYNPNKSNNMSYYKKEAIFYAWDLLTRVFKIDKSRLYVTYFGGDNGVEEDLETKEIWMNYINKERILPFGSKENFWEMADQGPCGPCSEIHIDRIEGRDAKDVLHLVNKDDPTVIEIWNLVFMQYRRMEDKSLKPLEYNHVDTGAGLERLVSVLQNKMSNYDTDIFQEIFNEIYKLSNVKYDESESVSIAYRIIADHMRTIINALADDIIPDFTGRGFVLSKMFKRACYYACHFLNINYNNNPFLSKLVERLINLNNDNEKIQNKKNLIMYCITNEEIKVAKIIWKSAPYFDKLLKQDNKIITEKDITYLHKNRNVPMDVIEQFAKDNKYIIQ
jgi:alanyl-tRNA synthetase